MEFRIIPLGPHKSHSADFSKMSLELPTQTPDNPEIQDESAIVNENCKRMREQVLAESENLSKRRNVEFASKSSFSKRVVNSKSEGAEIDDDDEATEEDDDYLVESEAVPNYLVPMLQHLASNIASRLPEEEQKLLHWTFTPASMNTMANVVQDYVDACVLKPLMDEQVHNRTSRSLNATIETRKKSAQRRKKKSDSSSSN
jgi:hypothetical protein